LFVSNENHSHHIINIYREREFQKDFSTTKLVDKENLISFDDYYNKARLFDRFPSSKRFNIDNQLMTWDAKISN